jgi:hypothetical protein
MTRSLARNIGRLAPKAANFGASLCSTNFQYPEFGRGSVQRPVAFPRRPVRSVGPGSRHGPPWCDAGSTRRLSAETSPGSFSVSARRPPPTRRTPTARPPRSLSQATCLAESLSSRLKPKLDATHNAFQDARYATTDPGYSSKLWLLRTPRDSLSGSRTPSFASSTIGRGCGRPRVSRAPTPTWFRSHKPGTWVSAQHPDLPSCFAHKPQCRSSCFGIVA